MQTVGKALLWVPKSLKRIGDLHAFRAHTVAPDPYHDQAASGSQPHERDHDAARQSRAEVHAVHARPFLRAPVPVLQLQPLPVSRGGRPALLREHAQRDADVEGSRLRLREHLRRRRHTHRHDRRAVRDARHGSRQLQHQGGRLRDQPEPPDAAVVGQAAGSRAAPERGRAKLRRRPAQADGPLREVRQRRRHPGAHRRGGAVLRLAERGHDLQFPLADRGRSHGRPREDRAVRLPPDHVLSAVRVVGHYAQNGRYVRRDGLRPRVPLLPDPRRRAGRRRRPAVRPHHAVDVHAPRQGGQAGRRASDRRVPGELRRVSGHRQRLHHAPERLLVREQLQHQRLQRGHRERAHVHHGQDRDEQARPHALPLPARFVQAAARQARLRARLRLQHRDRSSHGIGFHASEQGV